MRIFARTIYPIMLKSLEIRHCKNYASWSNTTIIFTKMQNCFLATIE
jgi:hypothetical protein